MKRFLMTSLCRRGRAQPRRRFTPEERIQVFVRKAGPATKGRGEGFYEEETSSKMMRRR